MGQPLPEGSEKARIVREMFDRIAPRYDRLNRIISLGLDRRWRRRATRMLLLPPGALVLDLASGTGDFCRELLGARHRAVGFDLSLGMLRASRVRAPLVQADVLRLPVRDGSADGVTSGFALRNLTDLPRFFDEVARVVRPGGRIALLETATPSSRLLRAGHALWFRQVVPAIGGALSDREAYRYLPRSAAYLPPPHELVGLLRARGFSDARAIPLTGGIVQVLLATRD